jgi:hypothetical protein
MGKKRPCWRTKKRASEAVLGLKGNNRENRKNNPRYDETKYSAVMQQIENNFGD